MKGISFAHPPPDNFDFNGADEATLLKHGIHLRRPKEGDSEAAKAAWQIITGQKWKYVIPGVGPVPPELKGRRIPHRKVFPHGKQPSTTIQNFGFAGCSLAAAPGTSYSDVYATWNCPVLSVPPQGLSPATQGGLFVLASWVGIDGGEDSSGGAINDEFYQAVLNHGLDTSMNPPQSSVRGLVWQWFAGTSAPTGNSLSVPVNDGDEVFVHIGYQRDQGNGFLSFYNLTQKIAIPTGYTTAPSSATFPGASIEWMLENVNNTDSTIPPYNQWPPIVPQFTPFYFGNPGPGDVTNGSILINMQDLTLPGDPVVATASIVNRPTPVHVGKAIFHPVTPNVVIQFGQSS